MDGNSFFFFDNQGDTGIYDTPPGKSSIDHWSNSIHQSAKDIQRLVNMDLDGHYRVLETSRFLEQYLPLKWTGSPDLLHKITKKYPQTFEKESKMYEPLVDAAHAILDACPPELPIRYSWMTRPNHAPKYLLEPDSISLIRPDAVCVLGDQRPLRLLEKAIEAFGAHTSSREEARLNVSRTGPSQISDRLIDTHEHSWSNLHGPSRQTVPTLCETPMQHASHRSSRPTKLR